MKTGGYEKQVHSSYLTRKIEVILCSVDPVHLKDRLLGILCIVQRFEPTEWDILWPMEAAIKKNFHVK